MATPLPRYRINDSSFADVVGDLKQEVAETRYVKKAGGGMTGALIVPAPTAAGHAATKAYADSLIPVGALVPFAGSTAPAGWLVCGNGNTVSRTTYAALFAVIGTMYGAGDGSTTFTLPTIQARAPVGVDGGSYFTSPGTMSGSPTEVLSTAHVPNITGSIEMHNAGGPTIMAAASGVFSGGGGSGTTYWSHSSPTAGAQSVGTVNYSSQGSDQAHENAQPYQIVNYIIKY